jgi:subtilisin-like proprotein convertase family protein/uncharacterized protein YjdB
MTEGASDNGHIYVYNGGTGTTRLLDIDDNPTSGTTTITGSVITIQYYKNHGDQKKDRRFTVTLTQECCISQCTDRSGSLSFANATLNVPVGGHVTQTATNGCTPNNGSITYSSGNTSIATVNATTGEVTGVAEGSTTITATLPETEVAGVTYCSASVSYTINVSACGYSTYPVGESTSNTSYNYGPVSPWYNRGYRQIIYDKDELCSGTIYGIAFQYANGPTMTTKGSDIYVYMYESNKTSFENDNDWIISNDMTLVYSGGMNCSSGWNWFTLDSPFEYTGNGNLVVAILDLSGEYQSSNCVFYYTASDANKQIYFNHDNTVPSMSTPPTGNRTNYRPNTKFCIQCCSKRTSGSLSFEESYKEVMVGETVTQTVTNGLTPSGGTISYSSSDDGVATVDNNGVVTGHAPGTVTITATLSEYNDGTKNWCAVTASYTVKVKCAEVSITTEGGCSETIDGICYIDRCAPILGGSTPTSVTLGYTTDITPTSQTWTWNAHDNVGNRESSGTTVTVPLNGYATAALQQRGYDVSVVVSDGTCTVSASARIRVSSGIHATSDALEDLNLGEICVGTEGRIVIGTGSGSDIQIDEPSVHIEATLGQGVETFIPDGPNCDDHCYTSSVTFNDFAVDATVTSADDIRFLRINLEHSFIGDIQIKLICPNNRSATILQDYFNTNNGGEDDYSYTWPYQVGNDHYKVSFGTPNLTDGTNWYTYCNEASNPSGTGANYVWSNYSGYTYAGGEGYVYETANINTDASPIRYQVKPTVMGTDGNPASQTYHPFQDFTSLIGCPLNGEWKVQVCDSWTEDNGWIFEWELKLSEDKLSQSWGFDVELVDKDLSCTGTIHTEQEADTLWVRPQWGDEASGCQLVLTDNFGCQSTVSNHINFTLDSTWANLKSGSNIQSYCMGSSTMNAITYAYGGKADKWSIEWKKDGATQRTLSNQTTLASTALSNEVMISATSATNPENGRITISGTPNVPGVYTYTITAHPCASSGCEHCIPNVKTGTITVYETPIVNAGTDIVNCTAGQSTTLTATATYTYGDVDIESWSWTPSTDLAAPTNASTVEAAPTTTRTYTVTATDEHGCSNSDQVQVTVNQLNATIEFGD